MAPHRHAHVPAALLVFLLAAMASPALSAVDEKTCLPSILSLSPCLPFIQSSASNPTPDCCQAVAQVITTQPLCLLAILDGDASKWLGIPIDAGRALQLLPACHLKSPPVSQWPHHH